MNGRLYDPLLGRMLSPDNYTQGGTQGFNRYSYVLNNPLKYTDPSGENIFKNPDGGFDWGIPIIGGFAAYIGIKTGAASALGGFLGSFGTAVAGIGVAGMLGFGAVAAFSMVGNGPAMVKDMIYQPMIAQPVHQLSGGSASPSDHWRRYVDAVGRETRKEWVSSEGGNIYDKIETYQDMGGSSIKFGGKHNYLGTFYKVNRIPLSDEAIALITKITPYIGTLDGAGAGLSHSLSRYVMQRGFSGYNSNLYGGGLSSYQIKSLKFGMFRGQQVVNLSKGFNFVGAGAAGFGYLSTIYGWYSGQIPTSKATLDAAVVTYGWKGGPYGAAFSSGYTLAGYLNSQPWYVNWHIRTFGF